MSASLDVDIVTLDEMHRRMRERDFARRFACFTFDDGYRDNRDFALPVMREFDAPFTVYVASDFASGTGRIWWVALERLIAKADVIEAPIGGETTPARLPRCQRQARGLHGDARTGCAACRRTPRSTASSPTSAAVTDWTTRRIARELCMSWTELQDVRRRSARHHRRAHAEPLQRRQVLLGRRRARDRRAAAATSRRSSTGRRCTSPIPTATRARPAARDFAIARKLGFKTAVTTRPGMLFAENADHMTALPRLSLNGNYPGRAAAEGADLGGGNGDGNGFRRVDAA